MYSRCAIDLQGTANVKIQLAEGANNTLDASGADGMSGLSVPTGTTVVINGYNLSAIGGNEGAGIGSGRKIPGGKITLDAGNGKIIATGGRNGVGIGNSQDGSCKAEIKIFSGTVQVTGGEGAYGIYGRITIYDVCVLTIATSADALLLHQQGTPMSIPVIHARLTNPVSDTTYLKCDGLVLQLPANYDRFAFHSYLSSEPASIEVFADASCTTKLGNMVTEADKSTTIPTSDVKNYFATAVTFVPTLTGTVGLTVDKSTGAVTTEATGGNIASTDTLTYKWSDGTEGATDTPAI